MQCLDYITVSDVSQPFHLWIASLWDLPFYRLILYSAPVQTLRYGDREALWDGGSKLSDVHPKPRFSTVRVIISPIMFETYPLISLGKPRVEFTISASREKKLFAVEDNPGSSEEKAATNTA